MATKVTKVNIKDVEDLFKRKFPNYVRFAVANTLTSSVYNGMQYSEKWLKKNWITRNRFLLGGGPGKGAIKFNKAIPSHDITRIWAAWGSPESVGSKDFRFMEDQEEGFKSKGSTPAKKARIGKNYRKRIPKKNRRIKQNIRNLSLVRVKLGKTWKPGLMEIRALRKLHQERFAFPGSNQFFFMADNQFLNFGGGLYQFAKKSIPNKLSKSGHKLQFPNLKKVYTAGDDNNRNRKGTNWMKKSSLQLKQEEINKIFDKAADQAFTGQLKLYKNWR
ncbi:MAG: hypothetical protein ACTSRG_13015 [Candidatus Helarchaeota archaeon]